jgi:hypothetical protein
MQNEAGISSKIVDLGEVRKKREGQKIARGVPALLTHPYALWAGIVCRNDEDYRRHLLGGICNPYRCDE